MIKYPAHWTVVWSGHMPLLPPRNEGRNPNFFTTPSVYDKNVIGESTSKKRKYTLTGKYAGKFSRTNPTATQFKPRSFHGESIANHSEESSSFPRTTDNIDGSS